MTGLETVRQAVGQNEALTRVERLLLRYPRVNDFELTEITDFLRDGTTLEIGLLSMNPDAWRSAEKVRQEYSSRFATTPREYLAMASVIFAIALVLMLFWKAAV